MSGRAPFTPLESERLRLRPWRLDDLEALVRLHTDPDVMRFIGDGHVHDRRECRDWIEQIRKSWRLRGFGMFAAELRETGDVIGWVGLATPRWLPEVMPAVEIGWLLAREHWSRGLASEGARESLRFGFETLGLGRVIGIHQTANAASRRVMEKLGMDLVEHTRHPGLGRELAVREIRLRDWRALAASARGRLAAAGKRC